MHQLLHHGPFERVIYNMQQLSQDSINQTESSFCYLLITMSNNNAGGKKLTF